MHTPTKKINEHTQNMNFNIKFKHNHKMCGNLLAMSNLHLDFAFHQAMAAAATVETMQAMQQCTSANAILLLNTTIKAISVVYCERK